MIKIMIVEDDRVIANALCCQLGAWGFDAVRAEDFRLVMDLFTSFEPQLVLLDLSLPCYNGYYWCTEIRKVSKVPIVFLSSASDNMNIVMAMNMGGDDFIPKPFDMNVLLAKIQAILRRAYDFSFGDVPSVIEHRGAALSTSDATLTYGETRVDLSKNEYRILLTLMEHHGTVVERNTLMKRLWETDSFIDENTLTVNINRLRKKLDGVGLTNFIVTKKGMGYIIE